jgi:hypothetical protein
LILLAAMDLYLLNAKTGSKGQTFVFSTFFTRT